MEQEPTAGCVRLHLTDGVKLQQDDDVVACLDLSVDRRVEMSDAVVDCHGSSVGDLESDVVEALVHGAGQLPCE